MSYLYSNEIIAYTSDLSSSHWLMELQKINSLANALSLIDEQANRLSLSKVVFYIFEVFKKENIWWKFLCNNFLSSNCKHQKMQTFNLQSLLIPNLSHASSIFRISNFCNWKNSINKKITKASSERWLTVNIDLPSVIASAQHVVT